MDCSSSSVRLRIFGVESEADLNSPCGFGGALADVEEPCAGRFGVATVTACATQVDDQRLVLKQAHKMSRFLALSDTNLSKHSSILTNMSNRGKRTRGTFYLHSCKKLV